MNKMRSGFNLLAAFVVCILCGSLAQAQATRTWVSGVGDDANPCSRTAPCKTFAGAISKTAAGGEISALDPGGFGAVTITKSITISGDGTLAGILSSLTNGIIINAGVNDVVIIRSVSIHGAGNGLNGIRYLAGKLVVVDNCSISGFTQKGIDVNKTSAGDLVVNNTTITGLSNGVAGNEGIVLSTTAGALRAVISNVRLRGLATGLDLLSGVATISNSVVSHNSNFGIIAQGGSTVNVESCVVASNATGVSSASAGTSTVRLSNVDILNNSTGIVATGIVASFGNNKNAGNTTPGAPNQNIAQQ